MYICDNCNREFEKHTSLAGHKTFCNKLPRNRDKDREKHKLSEDNKKGKFKDFNVICTVCKFDFIVNEREKQFPAKEKYFCSSKCAHSFSTLENRKEIGNKISKSLTGKGNQDVTIECKECKTKFTQCFSKRFKKYCSGECRKLNLSDKFRQIAIKNNLGGNRRRSAYGKYFSVYAGEVFLESSWELKVAKSLDENKINWKRPSHFKWKDNEGINRRYFPDFYIYDLNVYLDPKNPFLQVQDKEKIRLVEEQNKITILILNYDQLDWESIQKLFQSRIAAIAPVL